MSSGPFPDRVDASKLFARHGRIEAGLPLSRLTRLADYLADTSGQAQVVLEFGHDAEGRKQITGSVDAEVQLTCQRCLQPLPTPVHCELSLLVFSTRAELERQLIAHGRAIESMDQDVLVLDEMADATRNSAQQKEAAAKGGKQLERYLEQSLDVAGLVEDELILSMPLVPMHDDVNCNRALNQLRSTENDSADGAAGKDGGKASPFAVLAQLKKDADESR